jgi:ribosome-associated protein
VIEAAPGITLRDDEISFQWVTAPGPGGQNVNKVATGAVLRFDVSASPSLPERVKERLLKLAGSRATLAGEILIRAHRFRTRERNRADGILRLCELIARAAAPPPPPRKKTKPTRGSQQRRLVGKQKKGATKRMRGKVTGDD